MTTRIADADATPRFQDLEVFAADDLHAMGLRGESFIDFVANSLIMRILGHGSETHFPSFQFRLVQGMPVLHEKVAHVNEVISGERFACEDVVLWWVTPNARLNGKTPANCLDTYSQEELAAVAQHDLPD